ncbi:MAG: FAD-dependent oxidoreductase [Actinomycetota bacterium]
MAPRIGIVGGGVSGLYAAWRLSELDADVHVYERSDRLGGRLFTYHVDDDRWVEFGAMRLPDAHVVAKSLLAELSVPIEPFPNNALRHAYLRGKQVGVDPKNPLGPLTNLPYQLASDDQRNPFILLKQTLESIDSHLFDYRTGEDWARFRRTPLPHEADLPSNYGFWNLIEQHVGSEAYDFMKVGIGIESALGNWNAATALELLTKLLESYQVGKFYRPTDGWESLPDALAARIGDTANTSISLEHRLLAVRTDEREGKLTMVFEHEGEHVVEHVDHLILALPKQALEALPRHVLPGRGAGFGRMLDQVSPVAAFRLYLDFGEAWWKTQGWEHGFCVTDVPVRQVFYGAGLGAHPEQMLMASYADSASVEFWEPLLEGEPGKGDVPTVNNRHDLDAGNNRRLLASVRKQLAEMHAISDPSHIPTPSWLGYFDWSAAPNTGAWHQWAVGVDTDEAIPQIRKPFDELELYVCGEAFSSVQGWVEGALTSTELMLESGFGLSRPDWIPADYSLGA